MPTSNEIPATFCRAVTCGTASISLPVRPAMAFFAPLYAKVEVNQVGKHRVAALVRACVSQYWCVAKLSVVALFVRAVVASVPE